MSNAFTAATVSGYNSSPPADDGTETEANRVKWSTIEDKLTGPLDDWVSNNNTAIDSAFDYIESGAAGNSFTTSGSGGTYTITTGESITLYSGWQAVVYWNHSGSPATLNVDGGGAATINGSPVSGEVGLVRYNGTTFDILSSSGTGFSTLTSGSALSTGGQYVNTSGANTHTLPELSTTSAGQRVTVRNAGSTTVIVNEHANDSNAEIGTYYAEGDGATFVSTGSAWKVVDETVTVEGLLALTSDDSVSSNEKIFDSGYSEETDIGGWWDTGTDRLDVAFDCVLDLRIYFISNHENAAAGPYVNGSSYIDSSLHAEEQKKSSGRHSPIMRLDASDYVEIYAHGSGVSRTVRGDASKDETRLMWKVLRRIR